MLQVLSLYKELWLALIYLKIVTIFSIVTSLSAF